MRRAWNDFQYRSLNNLGREKTRYIASQSHCKHAKDDEGFRWLLFQRTGFVQIFRLNTVSVACKVSKPASRFLWQAAEKRFDLWVIL